MIVSLGGHLLLVILFLAVSAFRPAARSTGISGPVIEILPLPASAEASQTTAETPSTAATATAAQPPAANETSRLPKVSMKLVTRGGPPKPSNEQRVRTINQAAEKVLNGVSTSAVDVHFDTVGNQPSDGYAQIVKDAYDRNWDLAFNSSAGETAFAKVKVTIQRDGKILSSELLDPSGDSQLDQSIQRTLNRVTTLEPFPAGATDQQRTYTIRFNIKSSL